MTDKEARTPTHVRPATPPTRASSKSMLFPNGSSQAERMTPARSLRNFTPARLMLKTPSRNNVRAQRAAQQEPVAAIPADTAMLPTTEVGCCMP